jgi:putative Holliday junction resolvase
MSRVLAIDLGMKRTGLAVTDPLGIIATALETIPTAELLSFLKRYVAAEPVKRFVVGLPRRLNNQDTEMTPHVRNLEKQLMEIFPHIPVSLVDERFTSSLAKAAMIAGGMKKKDRQVKGNVDKISAVLILQSWMDSAK